MSERYLEIKDCVISGDERYGIMECPWHIFEECDHPQASPTRVCPLSTLKDILAPLRVELEQIGDLKGLVALDKFEDGLLQNINKNTQGLWVDKQEISSI